MCDVSCMCVCAMQFSGYVCVICACVGDACVCVVTRQICFGGQTATKHVSALVFWLCMYVCCFYIGSCKFLVPEAFMGTCKIGRCVHECISADVGI